MRWKLGEAKAPANKIFMYHAWRSITRWICFFSPIVIVLTLRNLPGRKKTLEFWKIAQIVAQSRKYLDMESEWNMSHEQDAFAHLCQKGFC